MNNTKQTSAYTQKCNQNNNENVYREKQFHRIDFIILHDEQQNKKIQQQKVFQKSIFQKIAFL